MLRCPVCKADNAAGPTCRRCRADLTMLAAVEARRQFHLDEARRRFRETESALAHLDQAEAIRGGDDVRQARGVIHLIAGNHRQALAAA